MKFFPVLIALMAVSLCSAQLKPTLTAFSESEISLTTASGELSGSLVIPDKASKPPVVLIIAGSGPTDRNCNSPLGISTNSYKMIAEELALKGIASVRYDKRGIGKSRSAMTREDELRFDTYADDAAGWIRLLKADKRFSRVIVLGHSEGSLLGMIASAHAGADGFISIAGAGRPADKILTDQLTNLPPGPMMEARTVIAALKSGKTVANVNPDLAAIFRPSVQPYVISWMKYDPALELKRLKIPVLIIQGTTDLQVSVDDAKLLAAARPDAALCIIERMNHVLKESDAGVQANMATYSKITLPLKTGLIDDLTNFIAPPKIK